MVSGHLDEWPELAVEYVDGSLDESTAAAVKTHLDGCPECAARLVAQRSALALITTDSLVTPPADLEAKVFEALHASPAVTPLKRFFSLGQGTRSTRPRALPAGPWLPALAGATAVVAVVLALTISGGPTPLDESMTTLAAAFSSDAGAAESVSDADSGQSVTTAASVAEASDGTRTDDSENLTEVAGLTYAALLPTGPILENEGEMASGLADASEPAYFFFETNDGNLMTSDNADEVASRLTSATGLQVMSRSVSPDVRAFAAFVPREDSPGVVHLLYTIGESLGLSVCLSLTPGAEITSWANNLTQDERTLAELSAYPATPSGWRYTTSTYSPSNPSTTQVTGTSVAATATTAAATATTVKTTESDRASTHVLVVIFMAAEDQATE